MEHVALEGDGRALAKSEKPDFEAAFVGPGRVITLLGSGSTAARRRAARIDPDSGRVTFVHCDALFEAVAASLAGTPNIEGAVLAGDTLQLFHRGSGGGRSAVVEVPAGSPGARQVQVSSATWHDLGAAGGVPLTFTDAATCGGDMLYLAVAEDTPNAVDDGPIAGAAVGVLSGGSARFALLEDIDGSLSTRKVEGIAIDPETGAAYVITDPDDPARPAELCRVALGGFSLIECPPRPPDDRGRITE